GRLLGAGRQRRTRTPCGCRRRQHRASPGRDKYAGKGRICDQNSRSLELSFNSVQANASVEKELRKKSPFPSESPRFHAPDCEGGGRRVPWHSPDTLDPITEDN